ncbi:MAG: beta-galactosidase, partial [Kiritimatiellae bacterium]|nr:beta-galactosidase [Kiritimatiellia bacterium]
MKNPVKATAVVGMMALAVFAAGAARGESDVVLAEGWRFAKDASHDADWSAEALDDSAWERVRVPHDWAIGGPFLKDEPSGMTGRLPWKGVGWYRLRFDVPASAAGQCAFLDFDGAMASPEVYVNGQKAGGWDYGYASFRVDATPFVRPGMNSLAVRLSTLHLAARWYPGAGLYRRVTLRLRERAHFAHDGIFVTTPVVGRDWALVKVAWETEGAEKGARVAVRVARGGRTVAEAA